MALNPAQLADLKTAVIADPVAGPMRTAGDSFSLRAWVNGDSGKFVWRPFTNGDVVRNSIVWANMTPADVPDITTVYTNRALYAQAKQISLQTMVQGQSQIASGVAGIRAGLQDCLTNLPTGLAGATIAAGWAAVRTAIQRAATRTEALFAAGTGTPASPADLVFEGAVSQDEVNRLLVN